ncbi:AfsR/SARP family transcriptional regulator [Actinomadura meridiana]|uniref:AfsR/SARP family transcriptional regulator n=1 Tax=Actinomadura meridiana TaxID=559626 RepID=A0ABP8BS90_9ACTN
MARFALLGSFEISNGTNVCESMTPKMRQLFALLLARSNQLVSMETVVQELWEEEPPKSAPATVQTYVYQLRKIIEGGRLVPDTREFLVTRPTGYLVRVPPSELDVHVFAEEAKQGRALLAAGRAEEASQLLRHALSLWTGPPFADVNRGPLLETHALDLREQRLHCLESRIRADVQLGHDRELIGELRWLVADNPFNEWFHGQLIMALSRAGRRNEALKVFDSLRRSLDRELGLLPSPEIQEIHQRVLRVGAGRYPVAAIQEK